MSELDDELMKVADGAAQHQIVRWLEDQTSTLLAEIQRQEFWQFLMSPNSDPRAIVSFMRQIYLEIVGYQPHVIEAAIATVARMPRSMDLRLVKSMLLHQGDEFDHGEMALRDYVGLGGSEKEARAARMSPESFAVSGVWWTIAQMREPFAYLGALYLFEGLTPTVTGLVKEKLQRKGMTAKSLEYIEFHSTEDIKHANLVHHLISQVAQKDPSAPEAIKHGFECFRAVYPLPLWCAAYRRSKAGAEGK